MFNYYFKPAMERKLRLFAEHGFEHLHWCDDWDADIIYTREEMGLYRWMVDSAGLECLDVHGAATEAIRVDSWTESARARYIGLLKNRIEFCSLMGGDAVVVHPPRFEDPELSRRLKSSTRVFDAVTPLCGELGVAIAVENCYPSDEKIIECYLDAYPPELFGFCFDSGHANINGNMEQLFRFGDRLRALHLHDNGGAKDDHQPPYWGTVDWGRVMGWIGRSGYRKPINFEVTHDPRLFDGTMDGFLGYTASSIRRAMTLLRLAG
jgi:sugar phosphate isomerase/epimerase